MIPHEGGHCQLSFLPANPSSVPHTLAELFELTQAPFKSPKPGLLLASGTSEIQRHSQMRRGGRASPWTHSKTTDTNLDCVSIKTHFLYRSLIVISQQNRIQVMTRHGTKANLEF